MRTITVNLYQFDELSDEAKEKAREWMRSCINNDFQHYAEDITASFKERLGELGLPDEDVEWSLSYSQGDGVAFYGGVELDTWLAVTKQRSKFRALRDADGNLRVSANLSRNSYGYHYSHWNTMTVSVEVDDWEWEPTTKQQALIDALEDALREHVQATSRQFERDGYEEIEYILADEQIDDTIRANEYEFEASGARA